VDGMLLQDGQAKKQAGILWMPACATSSVG